MINCVIDKKYKPIYLFNHEFLAAVAKEGSVPFEVALERDHGYVYSYKSSVFADEGKIAQSFLYAERLIKSLLWIVGGFKLYIKAPEKLYNMIKASFSAVGARKFDVLMMERVYEHKFEIFACDAIPEAVPQYIKCSTESKGAKIGFDAGGSDRKVAAVLDGEVLYSEEVVWYPKINSDPEYHYNGIKAAIKKAASYLPRIDGIGVSSAGIYVDNRIMLASLFVKVGDEDFKNRVKNMYIDIANEFNAPITVANDGDVAALAGAVELGEANLIGIAMGTSEAAGYIDKNSNLLGWLNELAFVPVDVNPDAMIDEWSGDYGTGVDYFSQDGVIKLASLAGIAFDEGLSPAQKLKYIQQLNDEGNKTAESIFCDIGTYLGYSLLFYHGFYGFKNVLLMGRVVSGRGGEQIMENARKVLDENGEIGRAIILRLPDEKNRRVGQAIAAAML